MTGPVNARQATADYWVTRMDAGTMSAQEEARLEDWLAEDERNEGLLLRSHAAWLALDEGLAAGKHVEPALDNLLAEKLAVDETAGEQPFALTVVHDAEPVVTPLWRRRKVLAGAMAASVAAVVARFTYFDPRLTYATNLGEIRRVPLADGSVMTMNSGTDLAVRMEDHARHIDLSQGEAWFEVAKDAQRPFVVAAGQVKAQAVGTAFSVRRRDAGVEVLVTEGVVDTWSDRQKQQRIRLTAGQRLLITDNAVVHYGPAQMASVERALAWRTGMVSLSGTTLADAADEFNRYNRRQLLVTDPEIAGEQMAGQFRFNDPEGFAIAVKNSFNLHVDMSNPAYIKITRGDHPVQG